MLKSFKERIAELRKTVGFCQEQAKLEFVGGITRLMSLRGINNAALAERMDTSPAYITKALRGDANFTIDSMVKITHALGGRIHIHVADADASVRWLEHFNCLAHASQPPPLVVRPRERIEVSNFLVEIKDEAREIYA